VSLATADDLRKAGTKYPTSITDYYLQLPDSLPAKVRELAIQLSKGTNNPYDKAEAIEKHLHGLKFDLKVSQPPFNADGVNHFLFESKTGYGDYFASAMSVMLRTVGVPARPAAGYSPGTYNEADGTFTVKDKDSQVWTQVYFPGYGWIDFEPTPNKPAPRRELMVPELALGTSGTGASGPDEELLQENDPFNLEDSSDQTTLTNAGLSIAWVRIFTVLGYAVAGISAIFLFSWLTWNRTLASVPASEKAYVKMTRLATLAVAARKPHQTPSEYADIIGRRFPEEKGEASSIADTFLKSRYGKRATTEQELEPVEKAWVKIRKRLARGIVKRAFSLLRG